MKREEIYVAVIIDTILQNDCGDEAYIFNTKKEALTWAEGIKKSMEDMGCPLCENQLFIQKVDTTIDYLNPPIGTKCPAGPKGDKPKIPSIIETQKYILGKFARELIAYARKEMEKFGMDGISASEIKEFVENFVRKYHL